MTEPRRMQPKARRESILGHALMLAKRDGYDRITRAGIADAANVSEGLINQYFGTMTKLRRAIMRAAIEQRVLEVVARGIVNGDRHAMKAPEELKRAAMSRYVS